jgi:hypothetical protein
MRRHLLLFGLAAVSAVGLLSSRVVAGQTPSLGEVAKKEAERRKAQPPSGKVYTNKDLPSTAQKPSSAVAAPGESSTPSDPVAAATEQKSDQADAAGKAEGEQKGEAYWKKRVADAREELRRNEMFAEALQTRVNTLNKDFNSRDNPAQRSRIGEDRAEALKELTRVKGEVERSKKQIEDIEEEARKGGIPAGWLR